jgi:DNA polymerase elongation subunit (family B)
MPAITQKKFNERKQAKKDMLAAQKMFENTNDPKYAKEAKIQDVSQQACKILMNSLFGATANRYFRLYSDKIAEGITMTGQLIIQSVMRDLNEFFNKALGTTHKDYVIAGDTDSVIITLGPLVDKFFKKEWSKEKIVDMIDQMCQEKLAKVLDKSCNTLATKTNARLRKIDFKRESIADVGIWKAKKMYALNVYDQEGVRFHEPKIKIKGLEIVRSSTPAVVRGILKEAVRICLTGTQKELQDRIAEFETEFKSYSPERIAFPRGVNNLSKYTSSSTIFTKGTPIAVRGALVFNHHLRKHNLEKIHQTIREGDKIKFLYLREPNTLGGNCIAFPDKLPLEFNVHKYVDYNMMWEKAFLTPLESITDVIGWKTSPQGSLMDLFT